MKPVVDHSEVPQIISYRRIPFLCHPLVKLVDQGTIRFDASVHEDILRLQGPIGLIRSVVIVQTHGYLNGDALNLLSGHLFFKDLGRKVAFFDQLVSEAVIGFIIIN